MQNSDSEPTSKRDANSLYRLTKRFLQVIMASPNKKADITAVAFILNVSKRRIYDIVNVLEGVGVLEKVSRNNIRLCKNGDEFLDIEMKNNGCSLGEEIEKINMEIKDLKQEIRILSINKKNIANAYITHRDLQSLDILNNKQILALKVPMETQIDYPVYRNGRYEINVTSENGQISVYYINNKDRHEYSSPRIFQ